MKPFRYTPEMIKRYTEQGFWGNPTYAEIWDRNATEYPDKEALVDSQGMKVTWSEAKRFTDRIALGLLELGYKKDDVLVIQLPNIVEQMLIRIACQKAGVLALPVSMRFREFELEYILKQTEAKGIVICPYAEDRDYFQTIQGIKGNLPELEHVFTVGADVPEGTLSMKGILQTPLEERHPEARLEETRVGPHDVMGLLATSGTTGLPKIVEEHLLPDRFALTHIECWHSTPEDIYGVICPLSAGVSVPAWGTFLYVPCKLALLERFDPEQALKFIERERITIAFAVPAQLAMMVDHPNLDKYDLSSLRAFFWSGAPLPREIGEKAEQKMGCKLITNFGAQDHGPISVVSIDDPFEVRQGSIGKPYLGTEVRIVDEKGEDVAPNETGEMLLRGPYSYSGFFKDPETTLAVWGGEKDGWFATGELVKRDESGILRIVGRKKEVIIRGGQNVFPVEIEDILMKHPKIGLVALVPVPDRVLGERVCACIIPKEGQEITFEEMVAFLRKQNIASFKLPEYMEIFGEFPMSGGGKISKRELTEIVKRRLRDKGADIP